MDFSIVFPTRGRVDLLQTLFRSLAETTANPERVEVLPVCDNDDVDTIAAIPELKKIYPANFLVRQRSKYLNQDYINYGSSLSTGKYIFILNDDVEFRTKDWDVKCFTELENYIKNRPDGVVYGLTDDGMDSVRLTQKLQYSGFPIISRKAFEILGYAMHPHFRSWGADIHLYQVYAAVGRVCNLKNSVLAFHLSPHTESREADETNKHVALINNNANVSVGFDVARLREVIGGKPVEKEPIRMVPQSLHKFAKPAPKIAKPPQDNFKPPTRPQEVIRNQPKPPPPSNPGIPGFQPPPMSPAAAQFIRRVNALRRT